MIQKTKQALRHVGAVLAALDLLDCFLKEPALSLKQIMDITGFTRNRVMRLAGTLESRGYLNADPGSGKITLGPKCLRLGKALESNLDLVSISRPILSQLAQITGESASLYVRDGLERVVIAREEGTQVIRYSVTPGQRAPLHAGAAGKVILAFSPKEIREQVFENIKLPQITEHTITEREKLAAEVNRIFCNGYAVSLAEHFLDVASIAAPVLDHQMRLVGAISISGPLSRFTSEVIKEKKDKVVHAAKRFSYLLGGEQRQPSAITIT